MTSKHSFFVPEAGQTDLVALPETEARHAVRALRLGQGDHIQMVDGNGTRCEAVLEVVGKRQVLARVTERVHDQPVLGVEVVLGAGLIKHTGRFETMLEKVAELGVHRIMPLETQRTERQRVRLDRARNILASAMKQSGSAFCTRIDNPVGFEAFMEAPGAEDLRLICHERVEAGRMLSAHVENLQAGRRVWLAVGPEGGFTEEEVDRAVASGFAPVSLGPTRLRAETASIAALAVICQYAPSNPVRPITE